MKDVQLLNEIQFPVRKKENKTYQIHSPIYNTQSM